MIDIGTPTLPRPTAVPEQGKESIVPTPLLHGNIRSSSQDLALVKSLRVQPVPFNVGKSLVVRKHYLHSMPGGTMFTLGVFSDKRLLGVVTLGAGPFLVHQLVDRGKRDDCLVLTRLWLEDSLPKNSESRVLGMVLRSLRRDTKLKFVVSYSDAAAGHRGTVYQASNFIHTGMSTPMALYDLGDGVPRHSRTVGQVLGSHSIKHLKANGLTVTLVPQGAKHRYVYFLDPTWRGRLRVPALPYPQKEA